jgi:hypothetical protein
MNGDVDVLQETLEDGRREERTAAQKERKGLQGNSGLKVRGNETTDPDLKGAKHFIRIFSVGDRDKDSFWLLHPDGIDFLDETWIAQCAVAHAEHDHFAIFDRTVFVQIRRLECEATGPRPRLQKTDQACSPEAPHIKDQDCGISGAFGRHGHIDLSLAII